MTSILKLEIQKILRSKFKLALLVTNIILLPLIVKIISHLHAVEDNVPMGIFIDNVALGTISYSHTFFFIPVWVIILIGMELSNGHVNRVVFLKSRKYFFISKIYFCLVLTFFFSFLGLVSFIIAIETSQYQITSLNLNYYLVYFSQVTLSTFSFSLLLLALVFLFKSPIKTFVIYFIWSFLEGLIFTFFQGVYDIKLWWLPFHLVRLLYTTNGEVQSANYHNPFFDNLIVTILPITFPLIILALTYKYFMNSDLKTLSD